MEKIKILHVINNMGNGGVETFIKRMTNFQVEKYDVYIVSITNNDTYTSSDFDPRVNYYNLGFKNIYNPFLIIKLNKVITSISPDIIHTHLFPSQFFTPLFCTYKKVKFITTEHGISQRRKKIKLFYWLEKQSFKKYNKIVAVSSAVENNLLHEYPCFKDKIININNGIIIDDFLKVQKVNKFNLSEKFKTEDVILGMVARLDKGKDFFTLIKSLKNLPNNYKLLIVGKGPLEEEIKHEVYKNKLEDRVVFYGFKKEIFHIYKSIDIFILSSKSEGLPLVLLEAMAAGLPCLGSDVPGINNLLNKKSLFTYGDSKQLANLIMKATSEKEKFIEYSTIIVKNFNFHEMKKKYDDIYSELLGMY